MSHLRVDAPGRGRLAFTASAATGRRLNTRDTDGATARVAVARDEGAP